MEQKEVLIEVKDLCKNFGETKALQKASFSVYRGEVRGLIGENGSGKSTASSIICGIQPATGGVMYYKGKKWAPKNAIEAAQAGIGMIVQETGTISNISIAENIFIGEYNRFKRYGFVNRKEMISQASQALEDVGLAGVLPELPTFRLDFQERKMIELARVMKSNPELLIVDETTTALSQKGREILYKTMYKVAAKGGSVLLISHDLSEMMQHCDTLTVLRDGVVAGELEKKDFDEQTIKRMLVGRELEGNYYRTDMEPYSDEIVLQANCITTMEQLMCISVELHKGEILGIGGLSECGMHRLGRALFGLDRVIDGEVSLCKNNVTIINSEIAFNNKIGYVSKDRDSESLERNASILSNIISACYDLCQIGPFSAARKERAHVRKQIKQLSIRCVDEHQIVRYLSGGNKQKVVFAKWIACDAEILILDCPTRGVDVGVKAQMYHLINEMKKAGKAIIIISEEMSELRGMCDRILIMRDGKVMREFMRKDGFDENEIIECMI
jgi:ribose transport system ATP-binding protein